MVTRADLCWLAAAMLLMVIQPSSAQSPVDCPKQCKCDLDRQSWTCDSTRSLSQLHTNSAKTVIELNIIDSLVNLSGVRPFVSLDRISLANCDISDVADDFLSTRSLYQVDLSPGNNTINCSEHNVRFFVDNSRMIISSDRLLCSPDHGLAGYTVFEAYKAFADVHSHCPSKCKCQLWHRSVDDGSVQVYVDCSDLGLTTMPSRLPQNWTMELNLRNNKISGVLELKNSPLYRRVRVLSLAGNAIDNIDALNNVDWIRQFRILDLRDNRLTKVPIEVLESRPVEEPFRFRPILLLGGNPWDCTCRNVHAMRLLRSKRYYLVADLFDISCCGQRGCVVRRQDWQTCPPEPTWKWKFALALFIISGINISITFYRLCRILTESRVSIFTDWAALSAALPDDGM